MDETRYSEVFEVSEYDLKLRFKLKKHKYQILSELYVRKNDTSMDSIKVNNGYFLMRLILD